jgi:predicted transcriptional regulator
MTTIVAKLDPDLARRVARTADLLRLTHEQLAAEAIRLFVRSCGPAADLRRVTPKRARRT